MKNKLTIKKRRMPKELRQDFVELLALKGAALEQIAHSLGQSVKTIKSDLEEIWRRNPKKYEPVYKTRIAKKIDVIANTVKTVKYERYIIGIQRI